MVEALTGKAEAGLDVFWLKVGHLFEDLLSLETARQQIEHIAHPDSHATDAGTPSALFWIYGNALGHVTHALASPWKNTTEPGQSATARAVSRRAEQNGNALSGFATAWEVFQRAAPFHDGLRSLPTRCIVLRRPAGSSNGLPQTKLACLLLRRLGRKGSLYGGFPVACAVLRRAARRSDGLGSLATR